MKIALECPSCHGSLSVDGRYDEDTTKIETCPACGYASARWSFVYVGLASPDAPEDEDGMF